MVSTRSRISARLGSPVSESWNAICRKSSALRRSSVVLERTIPMARDRLVANRARMATKKKKKPTPDSRMAVAVPSERMPTPPPAPMASTLQPFCRAMVVDWERAGTTPLLKDTE